MTVDELAIYADKLVHADPRRWRRLSLTITQTELEALRAATDQFFVRAIRGIPIDRVVCDEVEADGAEIIFDAMTGARIGG